MTARITHYDFGKITVDDTPYTSDVVVYPDRVADRWWRREGHRLATADLDEVLAAAPQILIVGTGYFDRMKVPDETLQELTNRGIEIHVAPTREAIELFNTMRTSATVVAALHLTC